MDYETKHSLIALIITVIFAALCLVSGYKIGQTDSVVEFPECIDQKVLMKDVCDSGVTEACVAIQRSYVICVYKNKFRKEVLNERSDTNQ